MSKNLAKNLDFLSSKASMDLIKQVESVFKGLPHLPEKWVKFLVKITPWLVLIGGIITILSALSYLRLMRGVEQVANLFGPLIHINPVYYLLMLILMLVLGFLYLMAFKPLKDRKTIGWIYLFWAQAIGALQVIFGAIFYSQAIVMSVISTLIGFYILFEVKKEYKD